MKSTLLGFLTLLFFANFPPASTGVAGDNYEIKRVKERSDYTSYEVLCTDCGKYITLYEKNGKVSRGDSMWYDTYRSVSSAAYNECRKKCD